VLVADLAAGLLLAPTELPVGIVTAVLGAPYFLFLLHRANKVGAGA
jgi:iron complex transport system permease protein